MAMYCPDCGTENPDWNEKCKSCGRALVPTYPQAKRARRRGGIALIKAIVAAVIAVIVLIVGLILVANGIALLGTSQKTTSLYTFTASYWDMNQLQGAISLVVAGVLLIVFSGVYLIVSTVVRNALRRSEI
jgi:hypothetical protein